MTCPLCGCEKISFGKVPQKVLPLPVFHDLTYPLINNGDFNGRNLQIGIGTSSPFNGRNPQIGIGTSSHVFSDFIPSGDMRLTDPDSNSIMIGPKEIVINNQEQQEQISLVVCKECGLVYNINADQSKAKEQIQNKKQQFKDKEEKLKNNRFKFINNPDQSVIH